MKLNFSSVEKRDIIKAWVIISLAFGILISNSLFSYKVLIKNFLISFFTVGVGFLLHELAHKFLAQKYNCFAEFRADNKMLLISLVSAFFGFLFAAPGGVVINGDVNNEKLAKIASVGPLMNIVIAIIFLTITGLSNNFIKSIAEYGFTINSWLALFNLIPIFPFDGGKIIKGSKKLYSVLLCSSILLSIAGVFR